MHTKITLKWTKMLPMNKEEKKKSKNEAKSYSNYMQLI